MKYFIWTLILCFFFSNASFAQDEPSETIDFPTISNNENINLNDTVRCTSGQHPDSVRKDRNRRRSAREIVKSKNFGFYTDIIYGAIFLLVSFLGWKIYQRFLVQTDEEDMN